MTVAAARALFPDVAWAIAVNAPDTVEFPRNPKMIPDPTVTSPMVMVPTLVSSVISTTFVQLPATATIPAVCPFTMVAVPETVMLDM